MKAALRRLGTQDMKALYEELLSILIGGEEATSTMSSEQEQKYREAIDYFTANFGKRMDYNALADLITRTSNIERGTETLDEQIGRLMKTKVDLERFKEFLKGAILNEIARIKEKLGEKFGTLSDEAASGSYTLFMEHKPTSKEDLLDSYKVVLRRLKQIESPPKWTLEDIDENAPIISIRDTDLDSYIPDNPSVEEVFARAGLPSIEDVGAPEFDFEMPEGDGLDPIDGIDEDRRGLKDQHQTLLTNIVNYLRVEGVDSETRAEEIDAVMAFIHESRNFNEVPEPSKKEIEDKFENLVFQAGQFKFNPASQKKWSSAFVAMLGELSRTERDVKRNRKAIDARIIEMEQIFNKPPKTGKGVPTGSGKGRTAKAGLLFSVSRLENRLKKVCIKRQVGKTAPVYLAAAIQYIVGEIIEIAFETAKKHNRTRISPRHIFLAVKNDEDMNKIITGTIAKSGRVPGIHPVLLPHNLSSRKVFVDESHGFRMVYNKKTVKIEIFDAKKLVAPGLRELRRKQEAIKHMKDEEVLSEFANLERVKGFSDDMKTALANHERKMKRIGAFLALVNKRMDDYIDKLAEVFQAHNSDVSEADIKREIKIRIENVVNVIRSAYGFKAAKDRQRDKAFNDFYKEVDRLNPGKLVNGYFFNYE